jgi:hypothetical protein
MNDHLSPQTSDDNNLDEGLVLDYLADCHSLDGALVRAGFARAGRSPGTARPDWQQFALSIQGKFVPDPEEEVGAAVAYLLTDPARQELRWQRMEDSTLGEPSYLHYDIVWLSVLLEEIRNRLLHWINFRGEPGCDDTDVAAAVLIVHAWSSIDPRVKGTQAYVQ